MTYGPSDSELRGADSTDGDVVGSVRRRRLDGLKALGGLGSNGLTDDVGSHQPQSVLHERGQVLDANSRRFRIRYFVDRVPRTVA